MKKTCLFFLYMFSFLPYSGAQTTNSSQEQRKVLISTRTSETMTVDGLLNEETWAKTPVGGNFRQTEPRPGEKPDFKTEIKSVYNEDFLYFGIFCYDTVGKNGYRAPDVKRDFTFESHDRAGITIDGFNDDRNSMTFFVNPYGAQRDYLSFDDMYFDVDWNGLWKVKTSRTDTHWVAEFEIPWKTLRYRLEDGEQPHFGINFSRVRRETNEKSAWSVYPRSVGFNRMEYSGTLTGISPPRPKTNIQLNPYSLVSDYSETGTEFKIGGEVKWAISPNLVADATVNTDFAQADVDQLVNNTSRFSVLFPEKRQFFLENASLFGVGISGDEGSMNGNISLFPFFSRRIGLDDNNRPVPIDYGGRIAYRSGKRNFGGMYIRQGSQDSVPGQQYFIGRYSENVGKYSRIGAVLTSNATAATGTNTSAINYTAAVDGFVRLNAENSLNGMVLYSGDNRDKDRGMAGYMQYQYVNDRINAWLTTGWISEDFDPKTGFISRKDVVFHIAGTELNLRKKWLPFPEIMRDYAPAIQGELYHQASTGRILEQKAEISPVAYNFIYGGKAKFSYSYNYQNILTDFQPLGISIAPEKYTYNRYNFSYSSDTSRKLSYSIVYEFGGYLNGKLNYTDVSMIFAPSPYISIGGGINSNDLKGVGKQRIYRTINLYRLDGRASLNPQVQLSLSYQKNSLNRSDIYNARFSWEYKPLSFVYLVFNSMEFGLTRRESVQNSIFKISFLKQF